MTIGAWIFLSTVFLSLVLLYLKTRDSWNWKKLVLRTVIGSLLGVLVSVGIFIAYEKISNRPKVQNEYNGIKLGMTPSDVIFTLGEPYVTWPGDTLCDCDSIALYHQKPYEYLDDETWFTVRYKSRSVIGTALRWGGTPSITDIQGIGRYSTLTDVEKKFGRPDEVTESTDLTERVWFYHKYHIRIGFEKGYVTSLGVFKPI
jgi:hypothetical protein